MRFYVDSCVLVAALTREAATPQAIDWLDRNNAEGFAYSEWVTTEFTAALSVKLRQMVILPSSQIKATIVYMHLVSNSFQRIDITHEHFREATRMTARYETGLRAGDALHLAVCSQAGLCMCTMDKRLGAAGPQLGVETLLL